jgi:hypothetical protein
MQYFGEGAVDPFVITPGPDSTVAIAARLRCFSAQEHQNIHKFHRTSGYQYSLVTSAPLMEPYDDVRNLRWFSV